MTNAEIANALWALQSHQASNLSADIARAARPVSEPPDTMRQQYRETIRAAWLDVSRSKDAMERHLSRCDREADHNAFSALRPLYSLLERAEKELEKAAAAHPVA